MMELNLGAAGALHVDRSGPRWSGRSVSPGGGRHLPSPSTLRLGGALVAPWDRELLGAPLQPWRAARKIPSPVCCGESLSCRFERPDEVRLGLQQSLSSHRARRTRSHV